MRFPGISQASTAMRAARSKAYSGFWTNGALRIAFRIEEHVPGLRKLHQKYRDRRMSLADACIVWMAETMSVTPV
jgi:hypothetical protein